jgi:diadenosine tetraphosphate (Ap4A) HIT family hydrolase
VTLLLPEATSCPFCEYLRGTPDAVFVSRGSRVSVLVNPRPYERGALLVIPNEHVTTLVDATDELFLAVQLEARRMARILVERLGASGINVFQNAGIRAGQTVAHYHVHVVPRYASSDPARRFREADYDVAPREQLQELAAQLDEARQRVPGSVRETGGPTSIREDSMGRIVIACYRPKAGMKDRLLELTRSHVGRLRSAGLVTERAPIALEAQDGTVVEVFEWASREAIERAHSDPRVQELWREFGEVCDYVPLAELGEAKQLFAEFAPVSL